MLLGVLPIGALVARALLAALLIAVVIHDIRSLRIPNALTFAIAVVFAASWAAGIYRPVAPHLISFMVGAVTGAALFFAGVWGGGDAKLLGALALFLEPRELGLLALATALAGGVLAVGFMVANARGADAARAAMMPYGVALAVGGLLTVVMSPISP